MRLRPMWCTPRGRAPAQPFTLPGGLRAELFAVPGKVPLYLEGGAVDRGARRQPMSGSRSLQVSERASPTCRAPPRVTPEMMERLARADVVLFDGTLFTDDEMIATGAGDENRPAHGPHADRRRGRLARGARGLSRAAHFHAYQQHQSDFGRRLATNAVAWRRAGWEIAEDGMEIVL